jgi:hypothetical protein
VDFTPVRWDTVAESFRAKGVTMLRMRTGYRAIAVAVGLLAALTACTTVQPAPIVLPPVTNTATPPSDGPVIDGLYEVTTTEDELRAAGVTDESVIAEFAGTYYWTFDNGTWVYEQVSEHPLKNPHALGDYELSGDQYTHFWSADPGDVTTATITVLSDGSLQFTDIVDGNPELQTVSEVTFGLHPWTRVGNL